MDIWAIKQAKAILVKLIFSEKKMKIKIENPNDCPFRSEGEGRSICNILTSGPSEDKDEIGCENYDKNYPHICPLLDNIVTVERIKNKVEEE